MTELAHKHPQAVFIGLSQESDSVIRKFVDGMGSKMDYRVAADEDGTVSSHFKSNGTLRPIISSFIHIVSKSSVSLLLLLALMPSIFDSTQSLHHVSSCHPHVAMQGIPHAFIIGTNQEVVWQGHPMDPSFEPELNKALSVSSSASPKKAILDFQSMSETEIAALPMKEIKAILEVHKVDTRDCVEKPDYVAKVVALKKIN